MDIADKLRDLELIFDALADAVIAHGRDRKITFFNAAAERLTGLKREQAIGRNCHEVVSGGFCGENCALAAGGKPDGAPVYFSRTITTPDGKMRQVRVSLMPVSDAAGSCLGVVGVLTDITELLGLRMGTGGGEGFRGLVGAHPKMQLVYDLIRRVAATEVPVLIEGESGTGKELAAWAIHDEGPRAGRPFVTVNCGALPEGLLESELFGHVKGAFTGAIRDKRGRFELAEGGSIFLDEVAELSTATQVKLLRVLQEKSFEPLGGERQVRANVRVISATNRDLRKMVRENKFREDLYFRLRVMPLQMPPLREKKSDIPFICRHLLAKLGLESKRPTPALSPGAMEALLHYSWPGNVRELTNALHYALIQCQGPSIGPEHLPPEIGGPPGGWLSEAAHSGKIAPAPRGRRRKLSLPEVQAALESCGGNRVEAARRLGVSRSTLYRYIEEHPER